MGPINPPGGANAAKLVHALESLCRGTWEQQHRDDKKKRANDRKTCGHLNLLFEAALPEPRYD